MVVSNASLVWHSGLLAQGQARAKTNLFLFGYTRVGTEDKMGIATRLDPVGLPGLVMAGKGCPLPAQLVGITKPGTSL